MKKFLLCATVVGLALPALAQDPNRSRQSIRPQANRTPVTFKAELDAERTTRLIAVTADCDCDDDGNLDQGELRVTCAGGQATNIVFVPRPAGSSAARGVPNAGARAAGTSSITATKIKGNWDLAASRGGRNWFDPISVDLDARQPNLCAP